MVSRLGSVNVRVLEVGHLNEAVLYRWRVMALHFCKNSFQSLMKYRQRGRRSASIRQMIKREWSCPIPIEKLVRCAGPFCKKMPLFS